MHSEHDFLVTHNCNSAVTGPEGINYLLRRPIAPNHTRALNITFCRKQYLMIVSTMSLNRYASLQELTCIVATLSLRVHLFMSIVVYAAALHETRVLTDQMNIMFITSSKTFYVSVTSVLPLEAVFQVL